MPYASRPHARVARRTWEQKGFTSAKVGVHWALYGDQHTDAQQEVSPVGVLCSEVSLRELLALLQVTDNSLQRSSVCRNATEIRARVEEAISGL